MDYQPDDSAIGRFCAMTGAERGHAQFLLEASNGNFENAVGMFYGGSALPQLGRPGRATGDQALSRARVHALAGRP
jgi:hypothetical protein